MTQIGSSEIVQTTFDYSVLDEETRVFVKVATVDIQARLKRTAEDIIAIGEQLLAVKERLEHGQYVQWLKTEFDMGQATAYRFMSVTEKSKATPEFITVINSKNIGPGRVLYALAEASDDTIAKVSSGEIPVTAEAIQERKRAEKAEEKARKAEKARLDTERKVESLEQQALFFQKEAQLVKSENEALKAKDHATIDHDLQQEKSKIQREYQEKLSDKRKELEEEYADRDKQRQFKAENTIHSLISHAVKRMAEAELTIDHIASTYMFQAVQQLGGKQLDTLLAQADSLSEALDRMRIKLTSSSCTDIVDANVIADSLVSIDATQ